LFIVGEDEHLTQKNVNQSIDSVKLTWQTSVFQLKIVQPNQSLQKSSLMRGKGAYTKSRPLGLLFNNMLRNAY